MKRRAQPKQKKRKAGQSIKSPAPLGPTVDISSSVTFVHKFINPIVVSIFILIPIIQGSLDGIYSAENIPYANISMLLLVLSLLYLLGVRLKKVSVNSEVLLVSNYRNQIIIPRSEILRVSQTPVGNPPLIYIHLKNRSRFGKKIIFLAKMDDEVHPFSPFPKHPIVIRLMDENFP